MDEMYTSNEYLENNPTWHAEDSPWKARQILKMIKGNHLQPNSICEIGCGAGEILRQLSLQMEKNISFVGYEISPDAFALCEQRKRAGLDYKLANLFDDTAAYYDIVMAIDVVEHVEDYFGFLRKLKEKGEYKILHIPLDMSVVKTLFPSYLIKNRKKVGHIQYFNKDTALATLIDTGHEIIDFFYTNGSNESPSSGNWENKLLHFPRKILYKVNKDMPARLLGGYSLLVLTK
jgi:ubiquinone/menaquinone biosynthesis C-methylase UbiE